MTPEEERDYAKKYYNKHKEIIKSKRQNEDYIKRHRIAVETYKTINGEKRKAYRKKYRELNKDIIKKYMQKQRRTPSGKLSSFKHTSNRRMLRYNYLNVYISGFHGHNIDTNNVIFLPPDLHKSIPYNQKNETSMKTINILAWAYLETSVL